MLPPLRGVATPATTTAGGNRAAAWFNARYMVRVSVVQRARPSVLAALRTRRALPPPPPAVARPPLDLRLQHHAERDREERENACVQ